MKKEGDILNSKAKAVGTHQFVYMGEKKTGDPNTHIIIFMEEAG